jgi:glycosyltransferase involved in cell wall biosynthesis
VAYGTEVPGELLATAANDTFTVAFAGRLEQDQKRIHDLTEIAANLKSANVPFRFLIAGSGPEKHDLFRKLESNGLLDQFEFLDFIEPQFLKERLYSRADALIVTSSWETGPIVIWEAMAAGLPVVTSRYIGSGAERLLWHEDNCLMFDIGDAAEAARQIRVLATDSNLLNSIRVNAFKTVQQKLSHDISVQNWERVLRAAMELPHLPVHRSKYGLKRSDGRLDRMIGLAGADFIRRVMRRPPPDSGAGGEWPHTISKNIMSNESFWALAEKLDER